MFKYNALISDLIRPTQTVIMKELYMFFYMFTFKASIKLYMTNRECQ